MDTPPARPPAPGPPLCPWSGGAALRGASMRLSLVLSLLRPAGLVAVGVSLGFTLSLLSVTWVEEPCGPAPGDPPRRGPGTGTAARRPSSVPAPGPEPGDPWEPRVLPYKPAPPGAATKKAVRYCRGWGRGRRSWA